MKKQNSSEFIASKRTMYKKKDSHVGGNFYSVSVLKIIQFGINRANFTKAFTMTERIKAENILYKKAQRDIYPDEVKDLEENQELTTIGPLSKLNPELDDQG